jgi:hypothetical protein
MLTLRVPVTEVLRNSTTVPRASSASAIRPCQTTLTRVERPPDPISKPSFRCRETDIDPAAIGSMTMKAYPSFPSAFETDESIEPGPRAIEYSIAKKKSEPQRHGRRAAWKVGNQ